MGDPDVPMGIFFRLQILYPSPLIQPHRNSVVRDSRVKSRAYCVVLQLSDRIFKSYCLIFSQPRCNE